MLKVQGPGLPLSLCPSLPPYCLHHPPPSPALSLRRLREPLGLSGALWGPLGPSGALWGPLGPSGALSLLGSLAPPLSSTCPSSSSHLFVTLTLSPTLLPSPILSLSFFPAPSSLPIIKWLIILRQSQEEKPKEKPKKPVAAAAASDLVAETANKDRRRHANKDMHRLHRHVLGIVAMALGPQNLMRTCFRTPKRRRTSGKTACCLRWKPCL